MLSQTWAEMVVKNVIDHAHKPVVVILGPTAVGKSQVAIYLAEQLLGEIVSADSRLFYRGMDIGTAKPGVEDRRRVPHHLIDVTDPDQVWNLVVFQQAARKAIDEIHSRGRLPLLVGGTGQYIRAVVEAWDVPPFEPEPRLRQALEKWSEEIGAKSLHSRLATLDPKAAAKIDPRNLRRTVRALEVIFRSGRMFSQQVRSGKSPYDLLQIGLIRPRAELYARVDDRIQFMLETGFVEEVQTLLRKGYAPDLPTLSAIGYREIIAYLQGDMGLDEAIAQIKRQTRVLVRRQANWFKREDASICWYEVFPGVEDKIVAFVRGWLGRLAGGV
jgi:tRNA dimethylallyltransferase